MTGPLLPIEMADGLRRRLRGDGPPVFAVFVKFASTEVVELVASAGFDVAIIDYEHSQLSESQVRRLVTHCAAISLAAVVRIPGVERGLINRLLEAGAAGLQVSMTTHRSDVEALIALSRYAPRGTRSIHLGHAGAQHSRVPISEYLDRVGAGPLLVPQIETAQTHSPLPELVSGCDVAFCGVTDLSVDIGVPGQLDHPDVAARVVDVASAAARIDPPVALGVFVAGPAQVPAALASGARYVAVGSDMGALSASLNHTRRHITDLMTSG